MKMYIKIRADKEWLDLLFSYFDKAFNLIFEDYHILLHTFNKYELKARVDRQMLIWKFDNVEHKDFDEIWERIKKVVPQCIDVEFAQNQEAYLDDYKEVQ